MKHLPLFFDLAGRKVAVIGEGPKADLRVKLARSSGADVQHLDTHSITAKDFHGAVAAFVATADEAKDIMVQRLAKSAGVPVNVADRPALCDFIMPAIVDRDGVVVAISTSGASPTLASVLRGRIEAVLPERIGTLASLAVTFRGQVNALIADPARRRAFLRRLVEGPAARLALAGDEAGARRVVLGELDAARRQTVSAGIAHIVGAGPGDPDLLTLKAAQLLQEADAVLHDDLVPPAVLNRARRDAEIVSVGKRMGRRIGNVVARKENLRHDQSIRSGRTGGTQRPFDLIQCGLKIAFGRRGLQDGKTHGVPGQVEVAPGIPRRARRGSISSG